MGTHISTGAIHHITLTVSDVGRARDFYTSLLGFTVLMELGERVLMSNGSLVLAVRPADELGLATAGDRFDENRLGLDHLSLTVSNRDELEQALHLFDENGVPHGEIRDLSPTLPLYVLAFRDPDNVQLELTAAH